MTTKKQTAAATSPKNKAPAKETATANDGIESRVITVSTVRGKETHRRAGMRFTRQPVTLAVETLTEQQLIDLHADALLIISYAE